MFRDFFFYGLFSTGRFSPKILDFISENFFSENLFGGYLFNTGVHIIPFLIDPEWDKG